MCLRCTLHRQVRSAVSFQFLEDFCSRRVLEEWSNEDLHALCMAALERTAAGAYPQEQLERILQLLMVPVVTGAPQLATTITTLAVSVAAG